jgi:serine protease inhibitor
LKGLILSIIEKSEKMKKWVFLSALVVLIATAICYAEGASGKWSGTIALLYDVTVNMKEEKGIVNGVVNTEIGDIPLKNGVIKDNDILFKPFTYNGFAVTAVKGKIDGDKMNVTVVFQGMNFTGVLKRVK